MSTTMLSEDERAKVLTDAGLKVPAPTEPAPNQDINDAIPEQIRKLSESIMKFGNEKK